MIRCNECEYLTDRDVYIGYCEKHKCEMLDIIHGGCSVGKPKTTE